MPAERVIVLDSPYDARPIEEEELPALEVVRLARAEVPERVDEAVALVVDMASVDRELLDRLPDLRAIAVTSVGLDAIDLDECARRGIRVVNIRGESTEEVATHAVALLLALVRRLRPYHEHVAAGGFDFAGAGPVRRLSTMTVGVVGLGRIGRAAADRLAPFGCRLLGWNRTPVEHPPVEPVALDELCARADAVTIHLPLAPETLDLFDARRLESLRAGALLVNTGRGRIVDTHALIRLLRDGRIGGAALDVFRSEPPAADELELARLPNTLLSPHAAFWSLDSEEAIRRQACANLREALA